MKPKMQKWRLEPNGLGKPGETHWLTRTGQGLASQESAGRIFGRVWTRTDPFLRSKPGPLPGYPDPLLSLVSMSELQYLTIQSCESNKVRLRIASMSELED